MQRALSSSPRLCRQWTVKAVGTICAVVLLRRLLACLALLTGLSAAGLPDSSGTTLPRGKATTVDVTVKNTGDTPEAYFVDGRLATSVTEPLVSFTNPDTAVPIPGTNVPIHDAAVFGLRTTIHY